MASGGGSGGGSGGADDGAGAGGEALVPEVEDLYCINIANFTDQKKDAMFRYLVLYIPGVMTMMQVQDACREKTDDTIHLYWPFAYIHGILMCLRVVGDTNFAQWRAFMECNGIIPSSDVPDELRTHGVTKVYSNFIFGLKGGYVNNFGSLPPEMPEEERGKASNEGYANICMLSGIPEHILEQILGNMPAHKVIR